MKNGSQETTFVDHLLVLVACSTALWSLGESLSRHNLARVITVGSVISLLIGYALSKKLKDTWIFKYDSYLWSGLAFFAALASPALNAVLPDEGFPFMLFAGAWLAWMVMLCGLVSWRDQTLLFLNIPCLSVFALVGTFDTYPPSTVLFFLFLVCSSLLYSRIHKRAMVKRALSTGVEDPALLERDAWRWMAGPEWAMASAGVIVLVSLIVGPILRYSLQTVSGAVKVNVPTPPVAAASNQPLLAPDMMVGRGPIELDDNPVFKLKTNRIANLRQSFFTEYAGNGWMRLRTNGAINNLDLSAQIKSWPNDRGADGTVKGWPKGVPLEPITKPDLGEIDLVFVQPGLAFLPSPGPVMSLKTSVPGNLVFTASGGVYKRGGFEGKEHVTFTYLEPSASIDNPPAKLPENLKPIAPSFYETKKIAPRVDDFAKAAVIGAKSDYEKAEMLQHAIEKQADYTLKAPAIPPGLDVVDQFLFETKKGYCDLFATSMAVCARAVGLPSRYVIGYTIQEMGFDRDGYMTVRNKDAHTWAEIYFEGRGWVPFDPTIGARYADETEKERALPWYKKPWAPYAIAGALIALAGLGFLTSKLVLASRQSLSVKRALKDGAVSLHGSFDRTIRKKTGVTRRFSQTTKEYVDFVLSKLGEAAPLAQQIVPLLETACYGPDDTRAESLEKARALIRDLRRTKVAKPGS